MDPIVPQGHRLAELGDSEPRRAAADGRMGARQHAVPVAIGLDHSHHRGRPCLLAQNLDVAADYVQIHGCPRRRTNRSRCQPASAQFTHLVCHGMSLSGSCGPPNQ